MGKPVIQPGVCRIVSRNTKNLDIFPKTDNLNCVDRYLRKVLKEEGFKVKSKNKQGLLFLIALKEK